MFLLRPPSSERLAAIVAESRHFEPSYGHVGATRTGDRPPRFRYDEYEAALGEGPDRWQRAIEGLRRWAAHTGACVQVFQLTLSSPKARRCWCCCGPD